MLTPGSIVRCESVPGAGLRWYKLLHPLVESTGTGWLAIEVDRGGKRVGGTHSIRTEQLVPKVLR